MFLIGGISLAIGGGRWFIRSLGGSLGRSPLPLDGAVPDGSADVVDPRCFVQTGQRPDPEGGLAGRDK